MLPEYPITIPNLGLHGCNSWNKIPPIREYIQSIDNFANMYKNVHICILFSLVFMSVLFAVLTGATFYIPVSGSITLF